MQTEPFGKISDGARLERIQKSTNFKNGQFQNQSVTPDLAEDANYVSVMWEFMFNKDKRNVPTDSFPSQKTNLLSLDPKQDILVWFGHASYFLQVDGKRILVDPVFSGSASPLTFSVKSFKGTDVYTVDDLPAIDYLFISHDHWDHLDYETMLKLKSKVGQVITGLGTGAHFERWGYNAAKVWEGDWNDSLVLDSGFQVTLTPARHFSGRGFSRNKALWVSFVLQTPSMKIYLGGDSGYDKHFETIGNQHGPFDLAILECGQYDKSWKYIHMMPEEVVNASKELKAKKLLPVHWAKFSLGNHAWDDPIKRVTESARTNNVHVLTPMIGEELRLKDSTQLFKQWWVGLK
jgi:L-ascorbate metabolism protein UlaG (beta-lactamase superfamily)